MYRKAIIAIFSYCLMVIPATADDSLPLGAEKKATNKSVKCWKRTWITSEALSGRSTMPICLAYEKILNMTCERPKRLICNWTLPPKEDKFTKPSWSPLDIATNWDLVKDLSVSGTGEKSREALWKRKESRVRQAVEQNRRRLAVASVDIDQDGRIENVVRLDDSPPCSVSPGSIFGVLNEDTKRLNWEKSKVFGVNADEGSEIMLYEGKGYMFGWESSSKTVRVYEGFTSLGDSYGYVNICQYRYLKGKVK